MTKMARNANGFGLEPDGAAGLSDVVRTSVGGADGVLPVPPVAGATMRRLVIDAEQMTRLPPPFPDPLH